MARFELRLREALRLARWLIVMIPLFFNDLRLEFYGNVLLFCPEFIDGDLDRRRI